MEEADLQGANLAGADFRRAHLQDARLAGVDLRDTNLQGPDLLDATGLTREQIEEAKTDDRTRLPAYLRD